MNRPRSSEDPAIATTTADLVCLDSMHNRMVVATTATDGRADRHLHWKLGIDVPSTLGDEAQTFDVWTGITFVQLALDAGD